MQIQERKFRIKVIERNDGIKMYHPQVWVLVDYKSISFMESFKLWIQNKKEESLYLIYDWRSITTKDADYYGYDTCHDAKSDGCGGSTIEFAYEVIEKYKVDFKRRCDERVEREQKEKNEAIKEIAYVEIP